METNSTTSVKFPVSDPQLKEQLPQIKINVEKPPKRRKTFTWPKIKPPRISFNGLMNSVKFNLRKTYLLVLDPVVTTVLRIRLPRVSLLSYLKNSYSESESEFNEFKKHLNFQFIQPHITLNQLQRIVNNQLIYFCLGIVVGIIVVLFYSILPQLHL